MPATLDELKTSVALLPIGDRAELAHYLLQSLDLPDEGVAEAWLALSNQRMDEVRAGLVVGVPAENVLEGLRRPPS